MKKNTQSIARRLTESAVMIALATILSLIKLVDLPYGGSITPASMLPILIIAYRYGTSWGLLVGLVHGAIQLMLDSSTLAYATSPWAAAAIILLDYVVAFAAIGFAGVFRKMKNESAAFVCGSLAVCVLRYACHVTAGATVWAGLSIPTADALAYSFVYNATYMLPEMLVLLVASFYISSALDFASVAIGASGNGKKLDFPSLIVSGAAVCAALVFDIAAVFGKLQNADDGTFDITGIVNVNWIAVAAVTASCVIFAALFCTVRGIVKRKAK